MDGFYVYKDGERRLINGELWRSHFEPKGWSTQKPPEDPVEPVLDFSPYDNAHLLHIAAVTNVIVEPDADRATLEEAIRLMWSAGGKPPDWLENALRASAPVPASEMDIPKSHSGQEVIETAEEFAARVSKEPEESTEPSPEETT